MANIPIQNYYVGKLNFCHEKGKPHDKLKDGIKGFSLLTGAIDCNGFSLCDNKYDSIFTIFCKMDEDKYYCIHNNRTYSSSGDVFVSELVPFTECLPTVGSFVWQNDGITLFMAKTLFSILFKNNKSYLYENEKYPADNFYFGDLKLYIGKTGHIETPNLAQRLLLSAYDLQPYKIEKEIDTKTGEELQYGLYKVIALWVNTYRMYNINEHRQDGEYRLGNDGTELTISSELMDNEFFKNRTWSDRATIPHMISLQRKFNRKNK